MNEPGIHIEALKKMSPEQKLKAAMRLYWSARRLKAAWFRQQHPDWTEQHVQRAIEGAFTDART